MSATVSDSDVLLLPEIAASLRISMCTLRRLIAKGEIRAAKVGGEWRSTTAALAEYRSRIGLDPKPVNIVPLASVPEASSDDEATGRRLAARQRLR